MRENYETRKKQLEKELNLDQMMNQKVYAEFEKAKNDEKMEREQFRREVFGYLGHLATTREHNRNVEKEKEKLIEDIRVKALNDQWKQRCEFKQKRDVVNKVARKGQFEAMKRQEIEKIEEVSRQKHENEVFNQREMKERQKIKEDAWKQRISNHRYGCELMEQQKAEELRTRTRLFLSKILFNYLSLITVHFYKLLKFVDFSQLFDFLKNFLRFLIFRA